MNQLYYTKSRKLSKYNCPPLCYSPKLLYFDQNSLADTTLLACSKYINFLNNLLNNKTDPYSLPLLSQVLLKVHSYSTLPSFYTPIGFLQYF